MTSTVGGGAAHKVIIRCEKCYQDLKLPRLPERRLRVTCPACEHEFYYRHNVLGFSPISRKYLLIGLIGGLAGFLLAELFEGTFAVAAAYGACLGAALGMADGFLRKNRRRLAYGLKTGAILGVVSGLLSGGFAQFVFSNILQTQARTVAVPLSNLMLARVLAWCVFGALIGAAYGVKENTLGDVKFGFVGGAIAGAVGGLMFDPVAFIVPASGAMLSRLVGFGIVGMAVSFSVNRFREIALASGRPEMYRQLTPMLPANPRLMLPNPRRD